VSYGLHERLRVNLPEYRAHELKKTQGMQGKVVSAFFASFLTAMRPAVDVFKVWVFLDYKGDLPLKL
jgi:hypothetical protein